MFKNGLLTILCVLFINAEAQINPTLRELVINVTAVVQENPAAIQLTWTQSTATGVSHAIHKKLQKDSRWNLVRSMAVADTSYLDVNVIAGKVYEYRVVKTSAAGVVSWGYTSTGIKALPDLVNRGLMLIMDTSITNKIPMEIARFKADLKADGYFVTEIMVDRSDSVAAVKRKIIAEYSAPSFTYTSAIVLGNVPVPYSGDLNPDAHPNHKGAWPTDLFYADIDGIWTDATVSDSAPNADPRTINIPGDGKYDQSVVPSTLEMEIGRIDFHAMTWFNESEQELMVKYLNKNHEFRNKMFVPGRKALMDEGGFATSNAGEGFGQSGPRAIVPLLGKDSLILGDYFTTLATESHLWSYGQGGGSYTSCNGVGTTRDFDSIEVQSIFTMLFGSYFGDYDKPNNLMRASLGSGTVLTCSWSSARPIWYYHHLAMGQTIGFSARRSVNAENMYFFINFGSNFPANKGVHNVLLGDPTLRPFYVTPPSNLAATAHATGEVDLTWTASTDQDLLGYNLYRSVQGAQQFSKINADVILSANYTDSVATGDYTYFLRAVKLETTASGIYYNESLGIFEDASVLNTTAVDPYLAKVKINIYPNPTSGNLDIISSTPIQSISILDLNGKESALPTTNSTLDISAYAAGIYVLRIETKYGILNKKIVKK